MQNPNTSLYNETQTSSSLVVLLVEFGSYEKSISVDRILDMQGDPGTAAHEPPEPNIRQAPFLVIIISEEIDSPS